MTASTYVQLSDGNGGLMANLSKTGFCVRAAKTLESDQLPVVRFQLPDARDFVESSAWIVWKSPSKKWSAPVSKICRTKRKPRSLNGSIRNRCSKTASFKNPVSKPQLSPNPLANQTISPLTTPAPVTALPVTLMAADSVPVPAYISPLAISLDAQPAAPSPNHPSSAPSQPTLATKVPPIAPIKKSPPTSEKTLAPIPALIPAPAPTPVASARVLLQSQKPLSAPPPNRATVTPVESNNKAPNLASRPAFVPPVVSSPNPSSPAGKSPLLQPGLSRTFLAAQKIRWISSPQGQHQHRRPLCQLPQFLPRLIGLLRLRDRQVIGK